MAADQLTKHVGVKILGVGKCGIIVVDIFDSQLLSTIVSLAFT